MKEIFREIKDFKDYQIGNYGNVISLKYNKYRTLKPQKDFFGYVRIVLSKNNILKQLKIHRLVAITFIPNPENKPEVNHKDGDKQNNYIDNLEWVTKTENERHAWKTNLKTSKHNQGINHYRSILTENEVLTIHGLYLNRMKQTEIAIMFNINTRLVSSIIAGRTWKHVINNSK